MVRLVLEGMMFNLPRKPRSSAFDFQSFVDPASREPRAIFSEQTDKPIRIPVTVADPTLVVKHATRHRVA